MGNWNYRHIHRRLSFSIAFLILPLLGNAQNLKKIKEIRIDEPIAVSIDRNGSIFIGHNGGKISKVSNTGELDLIYSPKKNTAITLLEAWTTLDILAFHEGLQSLTLLNRFLTPISTIDLATHIGYARYATFNYEANIWVIDDSDFSLKLLDTSLDRVTINNPLNLIMDQENYQITFIREYQNLLFISDLNTGILIFDNLGNYLRTLKTKNVDFFGFLENAIYYKSGDKLIFKDIYANSERVMDVPKAKYYLATKNEIYSFTEEKLTIYGY